MTEFASFIKELGLPTAGVVYMAWLLANESKAHTKALGLAKEESEKKFAKMHEEIHSLSQIVIEVVRENSRVIATLVQLVQARD
jgi:hypothetical protein